MYFYGLGHDAQNRLRLAQGGGTTLEFWYDGKNRQITRRINGDNSKITRSVWDGWDLLEERDVNDAPLEYYLHGARTDEVVVRWGVGEGSASSRMDAVLRPWTDKTMRQSHIDHDESGEHWY